MRTLFVGILIFSGALASVSQAQVRNTKAIRTVQVIQMRVASSEPVMAAEPEQPSGVVSGDRPVEPEDAMRSEAAFRVHDLSRRWVEFEMQNSFQSLRAGRERLVVADDPFAHVGVAQIAAAGPPEKLQSLAPIAVPAWMRDGLAFAGATRSYAPRCAPSAYRPAGFLSAAVESRRSGFYALMSDVACQYGIPTGLFDAMIIRESGYQPAIFSPKNAFGLTQLMPGTAAGLGVNRYDTEQNLRGGAAYLRQQLDRFGQVHLALAAYNAGPGRVRNGLVPRITETRAYVDNILLNWQRLARLSPASTIAQNGPVAKPRPLVRAASVSTY